MSSDKLGGTNSNAIKSDADKVAGWPDGSRAGTAMWPTMIESTVPMTIIPTTAKSIRA